MNVSRIKEEICQISRGGSGIIDKVRLENGDLVARKTFNPRDTQIVDTKISDQRRARFIREVRTQARLDSSYFMPILGYDLSGTNPWFIMPLAEDVFTNEIESARNDKRVPNGLSDILNALEVLHALGLTHRDIKPPNILLHEGIWKLSDFGLITHDSSQLSETITSTDASAGTQNYMAPEQLHEFKTVTDKADIYSFGAILHDIYGSGIRTPYSKLSAPGSVGFIIEKCTEENPEKRFKNVASLRAVLLTTIAKEELLRPTDEIKEWINDLQGCETWDAGKFEQFLYLVKNAGDASAIWYDVNGKIISELQKIDQSLWESLIRLYLLWIDTSNFSFDYCDVLAGRISKIYAMTENLETKCKCILSCARLGSSHNRFYVMRTVFELASKEIHENLAHRVALEIGVDPENFSHHFIMCAQQLHRSINWYHPTIEEELIKPVEYTF